MSQTNPYMMDKAESVAIVSDSAGFELHIDTLDGPDIILNVQACAVDLYNEVVKEIGPWIGEMLDARRQYDSGVADDPAEQATLDRIKGETPYDWAETMRDYADYARKAAKEGW